MMRTFSHHPVPLLTDAKRLAYGRYWAMQSAIGQCVALVSFAQEALAGRPAKLDWRGNKWFEFIADYQFGIGEARDKPIADSPDEWIEHLAEGGFVNAALFAEPFDGSWAAVNSPASAGALRLAPVTILSDGTEIIWHERPKFDPVQKVWHTYRGGFRVMPGQERLRATMEEAGPRFDGILAELLEFQAAHRESEAYFAEMFLRGRGILKRFGFENRELAAYSLFPNEVEPGPASEKETEMVQRAMTLFPPDADPRRIGLVAAVDSAWVLGGMGWWNDWGSGEEAVEKRFRELTGAYYAAMLGCLVAACEPK